MLPLCLLLCCVLSKVSGQGFYMIDINGSPTNNGLLISDRMDSHKVGTVCDDSFNDIAATVICREMGYNSSLSFSSGMQTEYDAWTIKDDYDIVLDDIMCDDPDEKFKSCMYLTLNHDCDVDQDEQIFLECECGTNSYIKPQYKGCEVCPEGSVLSTENKMACTCGTGAVWNTEECKECPANTYKAHADNSACLSCPEHSTSEPGSVTCNCNAGYYGNSAGCLKCHEGYVSVSGSRQCQRCPTGSSPLPGNTACSCPAGFYWKNTHCVTCSINQYSMENSTSCLLCPPGTVSDPGSAHCSPCQWGQVWQNYTCLHCSDNSYEGCPQCPDGYSIRGNMCIEIKTPMEQKASSKNWGTIVLIVLVVVLLIATILLSIRLLRSRIGRRIPPKSAAPLVPYHMVRESVTPYDDFDEEESGYVRPDEDAIYTELNIGTEGGAVQADPQYIQSDRCAEEGTEYVQADPDTSVGYSAFCGTANHEDKFTDNIYDNI